VRRLQSRSRALSVALAGAAGMSAFGGTPIAVVNPGFEGPQINLCGFGVDPVGWTVIGDAGIWRPGEAGQCLNSYPDGPPEGQQIVFTNSGPVSQTLTTNLAANTQYTLRVEVGRRADCCQQTTYQVQLLAGGTLLSEDDSLLTLIPGTFRTSTVMFGAAPGHPAIGQPLQIRLIRGLQGQGNFDHVRLESAPADCNNNGVLDHIDIAQGAPDTNSNGVPDSCEEPICPADCAPPGGNGEVNVDDLVTVILNWGPCPGCPADITHDDQVNVDDLVEVILNWGPC
jgi:hypothetical protein